MSDIDYSCILQFDDQTPNFTYGFQAGQIWESMKTRNPFTMQFCGEILELVQRMPVRCDYQFEIEEMGHGWYQLEAIPL